MSKASLSSWILLLPQFLLLALNASRALSILPEGIEAQLGVVMKKAQVKGFEKPDEVRTFPKGRLDLIKIGGAMIGRATFEPGWKWSESVQPIVKTKSCEAPHFQYHLSGVLVVKMDDGTEYICKPGDVSLLPTGHDAWVEGKEPVIVVDFQGMVDYAKKK